MSAMEVDEVAAASTFAQDPMHQDSGLVSAAAVEKGKGKAKAIESAVEPKSAGATRDTSSAPPELASKKQRRSTRAANAAAAAAAASSNGGHEADGEDDDAPLLPNTIALLFTTRSPSLVTLHEPPSLPVSLQNIIETPEFRLVDDDELPSGRYRPSPGQHIDFSDAYYMKKHLPGETLEKKGRKQERDRLIQERNRLRKEVEQLRSDLASASFYATASPVKGGAKHLTPVVSERVKESERMKKKQLQDAEDTLRRYEELLDPREPYRSASANGSGVNGTHAPSSSSWVWTTGGKGIPPPPDGVSPLEFLNPVRQGPLSGSAAVAQRKVGAGGSRSRSSSPASSPAAAFSSALPASIPLVRGSGSRGISIILPKPPQDMRTNGADQSSSTLFARRQRSSRANGSMQPLGTQNLYQPHPLSNVSHNNLPSSPKRRRRRRARHSSEDDDGQREAIALMKASMDSVEHGPGGSSFAGSFGYPLTGIESQDDDTDDPGHERYPPRKPMTKEEREVYWDYHGPPTITDSFFRANFPAFAGIGESPIPSASPGRNTPDSPNNRRATRTSYAFGQKLPEVPLSARRDFSIDTLLKEKQKPMEIAAVPQSAPPVINVERAPTIATVPSPLPARRVPRATSTRATTPVSAPLARALQQHRQPRLFRVKPSPLNKQDTLIRKAIMTAASAAFDSDGELSSVSSSASDTENQDSDTKWRTERATRHLEAHDPVFPPALAAALSPSLAQIEGKATSSENSLFPPVIAEAKKGARSRTGTPEPLLTGPITISIGGIKTRKRAQLTEYPTNELAEIDEEAMRMLRETYVSVAKKRPEVFGTKYTETPLGEWQVQMEESNIRGT